MIIESTDPKYRHLLGTKIEFIDKKGILRQGKLDFAGINKKLHGMFQVTIDRTPHWPVDPDTIRPVK
jgi:hypothetical protein